MPCWRSGRPAPTAPCRRPPDRCAATAATFTGWGRAATDPEGTTASRRVEPAATTAGFGAVLRGDGVRPGPAEPALHPGLPAGRRELWPPTALLGSLPAERRDNAGCRARRARPAVRHPSAGASGETVFLRYPGHRAMTDLFWPGDHRAGDLMTDSAFLAAMVHVETAWLAALVASGIAPAAAAKPTWPRWSSADDVEAIAAGAEADGNPVIGLVALLRDRLGRRPEAARWLHRGLTSQDVVDTALDAVPARRDIALCEANSPRRCARWPRLIEPTSTRRCSPAH